MTTSPRSSSPASRVRADSGTTGGDTARSTGRPVRDELLTAALDLAQTVGIEAFSYADLAQRVGIRSASIHHHFRYKHELVAELLRRYRHDFRCRVDAFPPDTGPIDRLHAYAELFAAVAVQGRMCLCGMSAAEWAAIGEAGRLEVVAFLDEQQRWLAAVLAEGVDQGSFRNDLDPAAQAEVVLVALEGGLLLARARDETPSARAIMDRFLELIARTDT